MSLFEIQRYDGKENGVESDSDNDERCRLAHLLQRIESKKSSQIQETATVEASSLLPFDILGVKSKICKEQVKRVLPDWLQHPIVITSDLHHLQTKVKHMTVLNATLRKRLKIQGIRSFFPVQAAVIPHVLQTNHVADVVFPGDVCVSAPTGSGKTLAFVLPIVQILSCYNMKAVRCLVVLPTRDLALQVYNSFKTYTQDTTLSVCVLTGDNNFLFDQRQLLYKGFISKVDIVVCTAGRLVDHLKMTTGFTLEHLEFLVIDEADRVLEHIQNDWLHHVDKHIENKTGIKANTPLTLYRLGQSNRPPRKLLFSATLTQDPEKLETLKIFQPKLFTTITPSSTKSTEECTIDNSNGTKFKTPRELIEKYVVCNPEVKPMVLYKLLKENGLRTKTLIFTYSVETAYRLTLLLKEYFKSKSVQITNMAANVKNRPAIIKQFSQGSVDILVTTDYLTRGIDIPGVKCVISYSAPKHLRTYIHRCGRTARAGEKGLAVTLLHHKQLNSFKNTLNQCDSSKRIEEIQIDESKLNTQ